VSRRLVRKILVSIGLALILLEIVERVLPPSTWRQIIWAALYVPTHVIVHTWLEAEPESGEEQA
jgi:hypothetical protein